MSSPSRLALIGLAAVLAPLVIVGLAQAALPGNCTRSGSTVTCAWYSAGAPDQPFTVPASIERLDVEAVGAAGGQSGTREDDGQVPGGPGAIARGTLPVTAGQTLYVQVGAPGDAGWFTSAGGFNGGGAGDARRGGPGGGGGGGASDVRTAPFSAGLSPDPRLLIAGGGGGAGAPAWVAYDNGYFDGGVGGAAGQPGNNGTNVCTTRKGAGGGGRPGTATAGGSGGAGGTFGCDGDPTDGAKGGDGSLGTGGGGSTAMGVGGGGGGGGLYGGGQGGQGVFDPVHADFDGTGGGGGGGSSLVPADGTVTINGDGADPSVTIKYTITARCLGRRATILAVPGGGITRGTRGDDVIVGSRQADRIVSGRGDDVVCPRGGNDRVRTGAGADQVTAGAGRDRIRTGRGRDSVAPGAQRDRLDCGRGVDRARGIEPTDRVRACERIRPQTTVAT